MAIALSKLSLFPNGAVSECFRRLQRVQRDEKFAERTLKVKDLEPIWSIAEACNGQIYTISEAIEIVVTGLMNRGFSSGRDKAQEILNRESGFWSDSIEDRVIAYNNIYRDLPAEPYRSSDFDPLIFAAIAAAVFLIGRGPSHSYLINRLRKNWAKTHVWFGLLAGLTGFSVWDVSWSHAAKGIEKSLRRRFEWTTLSGADLSWVEYVWLSENFSGHDLFSVIPKALARVLTLEIQPGVSCQFRLATDPGSALREENQLARLTKENNKRELQGTLSSLPCSLTVQDISLRQKSPINSTSSSHPKCRKPKALVRVEERKHRRCRKRWVSLGLYGRSRAGGEKT